MKNLKNYFFVSRFTFSRFQFNLIALFFITVGLVFGAYFSLKGVTSIFAASSPWTQTSWSGGTASGTVNSTVTTYESESSIDPATTGQFSLDTASGWYNSSWNYRRKITFDNTTSNLGVTSEALTDFPVLVKLSSSNIDYSNTKDAGEDLRFTDSDGTTSLSYEIEKWDESGTSFVWVKVPSIDVNSSTDYIYVYYGNSGASDGQAATSVWDSNHVLVQHLAETSGTTTSDSTSNNNDGSKTDSSNPTSATGQVSGGQDFSSDVITVADTSSLDLTSQLTLSAWVTADTISDWNSILMKSSSSSWADGYGIYYQSTLCGFVTSYSAYRACTSFPTSSTPKLVTMTYNGSVVKLYINGSESSSNNASVAISTNNASLQIGRGAGGAYNWDGIIDEVRISNTARSAAWIATSYHSETDDFNTFGSEEGKHASSGTLTSNIFDSETPSDWGTLTYTTSGSGTTTVKVRTDSNSNMSGATAWGSCTAVPSGSDLTANDCVDDTDQYLQYQVALAPSGSSAPVFEDISIGFSASDQTAPTTNASSIAMAVSSGGRSVASNGWNSATGPYFSWTAGTDNSGGSGLKGYCLYLGTDSGGNPATAKGVLGTSPVSTSGSTCQFIVSSSSVDLSTSGYIGTALADGSTYYLNIKAIDNGNNIFAGSSASFYFRQDATAPTNVSYISMPSGSFSNVDDMSFAWPTSGGSAATDENAGVLGYQYQINSTSGTWKGTSTSATCGSIEYIPAATGNYDLTTGEDGGDISVGSNVIYFRAVDSSCNTSSSSTYRTGNLSYGGAAPTFATSCDSTTGVTLTPTSATSNSFALSWNAASPSSGRTISKYYYMVNTSPPSSLSTITANTSTYISNSTDTSVSAGALTGSVRGSNTVYVVAVDDDDNYSASNCIKGTYDLNSTNPDPPLNLAATDASVKASSLWRVSLGWDVPSYKGTGTLTYKIQRSTDNSTWSDVTTTTGTSYIDTVSESRLYYWRVGAYDTSSASQGDPSYATSVSKTPKGTYTDASSLSSGPGVSGITTKKAKITWSTSRNSDSKVQYGKKSGDYFTEEPSNATQTTDHTINLTSLDPGTTYYYKAKWTDEDGNTGASGEKSFTTDAAPSVTDPQAKSIGLTDAVIEYTTNGASKVKIYFGTTAAFGGVKEVSTSTSETTYTTELSGLEDGTKYYYKINTFDSEDVEYEGSTLAFETLPRPKISNVRVQQVANTAQSTLLVTWTTNTEVSSIVTYYPEGDASAARDEISAALTKGAHKMIVRSLLPQTNYALIVKGRDKAGNEAASDAQRVTTATDTRSPQIVELKVEGSSSPRSSGQGEDQLAQLVVTWNTDEPSTSQVEFGEGTGSGYAQKTQEDANLTTNHLVIISGLTPSKVYHLRAVSKDKAGNDGKSVDTVSITPKATENALNLVIQNLSEVFGFLGGLQN